MLSTLAVPVTASLTGAAVGGVMSSGEVMVGEGAFLGIGSSVVPQRTIGAWAFVGAGSVVKMGDVVPPGTLYLGVPARYRRDLTPEEIAALLESAEEYAKFAAEYLGLSI